MSWIHVDVLFLIRLAVPPVGMCLGLVIPSEKDLGENQDHIQSSQVALCDCTGKLSKRFSMCVFFLGDDIALLLVLGFKLFVLTQMPFFDISDHLSS